MEIIKLIDALCLYGGTFYVPQYRQYIFEICVHVETPKSEFETWDLALNVGGNLDSHQFLVAVQARGTPPYQFFKFLSCCVLGKGNISWSLTAYRNSDLSRLGALTAFVHGGPHGIIYHVDQ